jgi:hypothetical protein
VVVRDCGADERIRAGHLLHILGLEPEASQRTGTRTGNRTGNLSG